MALPSDRPAPPPGHGSRLLTALAAVLGIALLALAAAPISAPAAPPASTEVEMELELTLDESELELEEWPEEEWLEADEECLALEGELEEEGLCEEGEEEETSRARGARECPLRSASPHAAEARDRLKVTLGYTTFRPATATIQVGRGSTRIGTFKRRLGRSGVLRFSGRLRKRHGKRVFVRILIPSAGRHCAEAAAVLFR